MRITIVEDNQILAQALTLRLEDAGHVVTTINDGLDASEFLKMQSADIVVLDINLPRCSGLEILRDMRNRQDLRPVLMLTARGEPHDRVKGLDLGADDDLVKPFDMTEFEARIRVLARRTGATIGNNETIGALKFSLSTRTLTHNGVVIELPRRELMLFECLVMNRGRLVNKAQIAEHIFGLSSEAEEKSVETYISRLRKKLAPFDLSIQTARGLGYMLKEANNV